VIDIKKDNIRIRNLIEKDYSLLLKWLTDKRVLELFMNYLNMNFTKVKKQIVI